VNDDDDAPLRREEPIVPGWGKGKKKKRMVRRINGGEGKGRGTKPKYKIVFGVENR
jgi:hypothetical protein